MAPIPLKWIPALRISRPCCPTVFGFLEWSAIALLLLSGKWVAIVACSRFCKVGAWIWSRLILLPGCIRPVIIVPLLKQMCLHHGIPW
jgi:hypothetical protein